MTTTSQAPPSQASSDVPPSPSSSSTPPTTTAAAVTTTNLPSTHNPPPQQTSQPPPPSKQNETTDKPRTTKALETLPDNHATSPPASSSSPPPPSTPPPSPPSADTNNKNKSTITNHEDDHASSTDEAKNTSASPAIPTPTLNGDTNNKPYGTKTTSSLASNVPQDDAEASTVSSIKGNHVPPSNPANSNNKTGAIVGGIVGGILGAAFLGGLLTWLNRHGGCTRKNKQSTDFEDYGLADTDFPAVKTPAMQSMGLETHVPPFNDQGYATTKDQYNQPQYNAEYQPQLDSNDYSDQQPYYYAQEGYYNTTQQQYNHGVNGVTYPMANTYSTDQFYKPDQRT
ncbi:uncharacterized protein B0P05DRAFT_530996 [Gilbertella persicaria]|uniref:uncharacterized protein n=1 Tax=Gilbertella persicaria TaxID=101096 RepID=UPI00221EEC9F|nr:uncharacterized protein B0P05DRAFT_530996 [Gilbertella persicaria]KAI8087991.1 hypothetical protein B0P05DRAFT_530996 [Gilbertella persicaria]